MLLPEFIRAIEHWVSPYRESRSRIIRDETLFYPQLREWK